MIKYYGFFDGARARVVEGNVVDYTYKWKWPEDVGMTGEEAMQLPAVTYFFKEREKYLSRNKK